MSGRNFDDVGCVVTSSASAEQRLTASWLGEASPLVSRLAAEILWVMNLFPSNIGPAAKQSAVREAWSWSGEELPQDHPLLDRLLLSGLGSGGPGFLAHHSRELRFFINSTREFKARDTDARRTLVSDPIGYATWLDQVPEKDTAS